VKIYTASYNGILDEYKNQVTYASPLDADAIVTWQDCSGSPSRLIEMSRKFFPKPVYTMQHGRRASRDYDAPLNRPFQSDKFLCWGKWDYDNMVRMGLPAEIVGCPLTPLIRGKVRHEEKIILFIPVNTGKEEPDNIRVYNELLKMKLDKVTAGLTANYDKLRDQWNSEDLTRHTLADNFTIITKVLPWHDHKFYSEGVIKGFQDSARNNQSLFELLRNVDLVVGLDEGTSELFAIAHDVPVIVVDGFEYRWKEGKTQIPHTPGMAHCKLDELQSAIEYTLMYPDQLKEQRLMTAENELSILSITDPVSRIHKAIGSEKTTK
jgi:hypothetical protein